MCRVHWTEYALKCTLVTVHCTPRCKLYTGNWTVYNTHCKLYTVEYILYSLRLTLNSEKCTVYTVQCTQCMWAHPCSSPIGRGQPILKGQFVESTQAPAPAPAKLLHRIRLDTANATAEVRIATLGPNMIKYLSCLTLWVDMVASYGRALAWSTELVSLLGKYAQK